MSPALVVETFQLSSHFFYRRVDGDVDLVGLSGRFERLGRDVDDRVYPEIVRLVVYRHRDIDERRVKALHLGAASSTCLRIASEMSKW